MYLYCLNIGVQSIFGLFLQFKIEKKQPSSRVENIYVKTSFNIPLKKLMQSRICIDLYYTNPWCNQKKGMFSFWKFRQVVFPISHLAETSQVNRHIRVLLGDCRHFWKYLAIWDRFIAQPQAIPSFWGLVFPEIYFKLQLTFNLLSFL